MYAQWIEGGVPVHRGDFEQIRPRITTDGAGGAVISWMDTRNGTPEDPDESYDIHARRIDTLGTRLWGEPEQRCATVVMTKERRYRAASISIA